MSASLYGKIGFTGAAVNASFYGGSAPVPPTSPKEQEKISFNPFTIFVLEQREYENQVAQATANLAVAKAKLAAAISGNRPQEVAQAYVEQAKAALENAEIQLQDTVIKAPSDGTIGLKSVEVGELVAVGKPLFNITNLSDVWIGANIEETSIGKINLGNRAEFTVDAYPGKTFTGEVIETGPASGSQFAVLPTENAAGNFTKVTQRLPIKIKANATEHVLKPGMSAIITVYVQ